MTKVIRHFLLVACFGMQQLSALAADSQKVVKRVVYGKSTLGQKLVGHLIYANGDFSNRKAVVVTDGIHGNEFSGVAEQLTKIWSTEEQKEFNKFIQQGGILIVAPRLNPDGINKGKRLVVSGIDLNRDFNPYQPKNFLSRPESFYLADWVEKTLKNFKAQLVFAMDYHCCANALIFAPVSSKDKEQMYQQFNNIVFESLKTSIDREFKMGPTKDIFGYSTLGTLKDYWSSSYGAASFTFEGGTPQGEIKFLNGHQKWWKNIFTMVTGLAQVQMVQMGHGLAPAIVANGRKSDFGPYSE